jgi:uncharacterized repeat protein (TIGR01451 family)
MAISQGSRLFVSLFVALLLSSASIAPKPAVAIGTADLAVSLTPSKNHLKFGETMSLSVTVKNLGPDAATGVEVGVGVSDSFANFGGNCPDGTVSSICSLGSLASGAVITFPYFVGACCSCCPDRVGVAVASVNHDADTVDPVIENNQARLETKLTGKPPF